MVYSQEGNELIGSSAGCHYPTHRQSATSGHYSGCDITEVTAWDNIYGLVGILHSRLFQTGISLEEEYNLWQ